MACAKDYGYLSSLFRNSPQGYVLQEVVLDAKGAAMDFIFLDANPAFERIAGFKFEKIRGKQASRVMPLLANKGIVEVFGQVALKKRPFTFEYHAQHSGHSYDISSFSPSPRQFVVVFSDITERKQEESTLRLREKERSQILENMPEPLVFLDQHLKMQWCNRAAAALAGKASQEICGKRVCDLWCKRAIPRKGCPVARSLKSGRVEEGEISLPDGRILLVRGYPIRDDQGRISGVVEAAEDITLRKRTEDDLRKSEGKYRLLAEHVTDLIWALNLKNRFVFASPAVYELTGYQVDEFTRLSLDDVLHPDSARLAKKAIADELLHHHSRGIRTITLELLVMRQGGMSLWVEAQCKLMPDGKGGIMGVVGVARDISKRKVVEEALKKSEEQYRTLVEHLGVGVYRVTIEDGGHFLQTNPAMHAMLGYTAEELRRIKVESVYADPRERSGFLAEILSLGRVHNKEFKIKRKDGTYAWGRISATLNHDGKGGHRYVDGTIEDVTEMRRAQEALRASERKYRELVEMLPAVTYIADIVPPFTMRYVSPQIEELTGYPPDAFIRDRGLWRKCVHPEDLSRIVKELVTFISMGEPRKNEFRLYRKDKGEAWVHTEAMVVKNEKGEPLFLQGFMFDISKRKATENEVRQANIKLQQAQQQLVQSSKMAAMGQLIAGISHELNQPLTGIKGFSQVALMECQDDNPLRKDLMKIFEQAGRMDRIIKQMRLFSRKSEFQLAPVNINQAVEEAVGLLQHQFVISNIVVDSLLAKDLPPIMGDVNQLQQVFLNLLTNARDAILLSRGKGGVVTLRSDLDLYSGCVQVTVQDNGPGMTREMAGKIFDPFFTTKAPDKGMGLGLSIVYGIIESHKGKIEVRSSPGEGATFIVSIPSA